ncbi:MAG: citrate/2-methylcitrate synthase [Ruminococcaceae bacterium]|nr:citrate/2-methylcitrate synthase [Oscillospiraceae bacterium]
MDINNSEKFKLNNLDAYSIDYKNYSKIDVKRGLRNIDGSGVLAGLTKVCEIHGYVVSEGEKIPDEGKLSLRGYNINDLVSVCGEDGRFSYEEVSFLLLMGHLPNIKEFEGFKKYLTSEAYLPHNFAEDMILKSPSRDIMNKLARSVLTLYSYDENADDTSVENVLRQSVSLIAKLPILASYGYRAKTHYFDGKSLILHQPKKEYSIAENILHMIRDDNKFTPEEAQILDIALMLHAEHGGGNNSAFTCRVLTSSGTDTYSAISGAINALKGPKHGGANAKVIQMFDDFKANISDWTDEDEVYDYLVKTLNKQTNDKSGLIYGIGHAVYTLSDPRTKILKEKAKILAEERGKAEEFALYEMVEKLAPQAFYNVKGTDKTVSANVDFYSGFVYSMLGIPKELFTPLFAIARVSGWCAHRLEELVSGGRILRPAYKSVCGYENEIKRIGER